MALPNKTNLITLDFAYQGSPFCFVEAKSGQNTTSLDFVYQGRPFVGATEVASQSSLPLFIYHYRQQGIM